MHTILRFGHVRFVSDLTFEHKDKNRKQLYRRGNLLGYNHVWSFTQELFAFWKTDLAFAFREAEFDQISAPVTSSVYLDKLSGKLSKNPLFYLYLRYLKLYGTWLARSSLQQE